MSIVIVTGIAMCTAGAIVAVSTAICVIWRGAATQDAKLQYIGGNIAASFCVLAGIAAFVLDIAIRLSK